MRSPNTSSCAPSGVAICFFRARWPSNASSAMAATVNATAKRFAHVPRPNKLTAANPTATRSSVILFGVQPVSKMPAMILLRSEAEASGTPKSCDLKGLFAMTYGQCEFWNTVSAPAVSVRCLPIAALRAAGDYSKTMGQSRRAFRRRTKLAAKFRTASPHKTRGHFAHAC